MVEKVVEDALCGVGCGLTPLAYCCDDAINDANLIATISLLA
jgi:hypothetical protein